MVMRPVGLVRQTAARANETYSVCHASDLTEMAEQAGGKAQLTPMDSYAGKEKLK